MNTRTMGIAGMVGGLGLLLVEVRELVVSGSEPLGTNIDRIDSIGYLVWGLGMAAVMYALFRIEATGHNRILRLTPLLAMAGFVAMAVGSLAFIIGLPTAWSDILVGIAFPLLLIGTLLTGILTIVAGTLPGWRKFMPLVCILIIPLMLMLSPYFTILFGLSWIALGYAVASLPQESPSVAAVSG